MYFFVRNIKRALRKFLLLGGIIETFKDNSAVHSKSQLCINFPK